MSFVKIQSDNSDVKCDEQHSVIWPLATEAVWVEKVQSLLSAWDPDTKYIRTPEVSVMNTASSQEL